MSGRHGKPVAVHSSWVGFTPHRSLLPPKNGLSGRQWREAGVYRGGSKPPGSSLSPRHNRAEVPPCLLFAEGPETVGHPNFRQPDLVEMNPAMVMKLFSCQPRCYFGIKPSDFWDFYALGSNRIKGFAIQLNNLHHPLYFIPFPSVFLQVSASCFPGAFSGEVH